jgi:hypothetical protein
MAYTSMGRGEGLRPGMKNVLRGQVDLLRHGIQPVAGPDVTTVTMSTLEVSGVLQSKTGVSLRFGSLRP